MTVFLVLGLKILASLDCIPQSSAPQPFNENKVLVCGLSV
ncbi:Uncharacterised protein [Salmonella enterica subsp. enterica serovar Typhi]|nr:Uncharacterised protein [Salmonella enterica subsp. enterica serovar Typhi]CXD14766.1 Uncharacterised protein [Salmonella enterica subsp. enterica serovar Typhi]